MNIEKDILRILEDVLSLKGRAATYTASSPLLGGVPELDSMAVVAVLNSLEEFFGIVIDDDEIDGSLFATVGSLTEFVQGKLG